MRVPVAAAVLVLLAACGDVGADADGRELTVFAAASLTDAFSELAERFESTHPGTAVELNFGGSSSLREQILAGAPADVFASADPTHMDALADAGAIADQRTFATNRVQIAVPVGNPAGVDDLGDLADRELLVGLCAPAVPCGQLALETLGAAGVTAAVDTEEADVRALLTKLEAGELDAGIVYVTDVLASDRVEGIAIPARHGAVARYPIAVTTEAGSRRAAESFVDLVLSGEGRAVLARYGFGRP